KGTIHRLYPVCGETMLSEAGRRVAFCAAICLVALARSAAAQDSNNSFEHALIPIQDQPTANAPPANGQPTTQPAASQPAAAALDPGMISAGEAAFSRSCTSCHDAQRSLQKSKSFGGWLSTVQRMAAKDGADINSADHAAIATYLASVTGGSGASGDGGD